MLENNLTSEAVGCGRGVKCPLCRAVDAPVEVARPRDDVADRIVGHIVQARDAQSVWYRQAEALARRNGWVERPTRENRMANLAILDDARGTTWRHRYGNFVGSDRALRAALAVFPGDIHLMSIQAVREGRPVMIYPVEVSDRPDVVISADDEALLATIDDEVVRGNMRRRLIRTYDQRVLRQEDRVGNDDELHQALIRQAVIDAHTRPAPVPRAPPARVVRRCLGGCGRDHRTSRVCPACETNHCCTANERCVECTDARRR
jgi:hypothetical protein